MGRPLNWHPEEVRRLRKMHNAGITSRERYIEAFGRSWSSIDNKIRYEGLPGICDSHQYGQVPLAVENDDAGHLNAVLTARPSGFPAFNLPIWRRRAA